MICDIDRFGAYACTWIAVFPKGTLRCLPRGDVTIYQPCFRQRRGGSIVACAGLPGDTRFSRFVTR